MAAGRTGKNIFIEYLLDTNCKVEIEIMTVKVKRSSQQEQEPRHSRKIGVAVSPGESGAKIA